MDLKNYKQQPLEHYLDKMKALILDMESGRYAHTLKGYKLAASLTRNILPELSSIQTRKVLLFLQEKWLLNDMLFFVPELRKVDLCGVNLKGATLSSMDLFEANLCNADLSEAKLKCTNLSSANLSNANLSGANLFFANLFNANLSSAELKGANLCETALHGADLSRTDLKEVDLQGAIYNKHTIWPAGFTPLNSEMVDGDSDE